MENRPQNSKLKQLYDKYQYLLTSEQQGCFKYLMSEINGTIQSAKELEPDYLLDAAVDKFNTGNTKSPSGNDVTLFILSLTEEARHLDSRKADNIKNNLASSSHQQYPELLPLKETLTKLSSERLISESNFWAPYIGERVDIKNSLLYDTSSPSSLAADDIATSEHPLDNRGEQNDAVYASYDSDSYTRQSTGTDEENNEVVANKSDAKNDTDSPKKPAGDSDSTTPILSTRVNTNLVGRDYVGEIKVILASGDQYVSDIESISNPNDDNKLERLNSLLEQIGTHGVSIKHSKISESSDISVWNELRIKLNSALLAAENRSPSYHLILEANELTHELWKDKFGKSTHKSMHSYPKTNPSDLKTSRTDKLRRKPVARYSSVISKPVSPSHSPKCFTSKELLRDFKARNLIDLVDLLNSGYELDEAFNQIHSDIANEYSALPPLILKDFDIDNPSFMKSDAKQLAIELVIKETKEHVSGLADKTKGHLDYLQNIENYSTDQDKYRELAKELSVLKRQEQSPEYKKARAVYEENQRLCEEIENGTDDLDSKYETIKQIFEKNEAAFGTYRDKFKSDRPSNAIMKQARSLEYKSEVVYGVENKSKQATESLAEILKDKTLVDNTGLRAGEVRALETKSVMRHVHLGSNDIIQTTHPFTKTTAMYLEKDCQGTVTSYSVLKTVDEMRLVAYEQAEQLLIDWPEGKPIVISIQGDYQNDPEHPRVKQAEILHAALLVMSVAMGKNPPQIIPVKEAKCPSKWSFGRPENAFIKKMLGDEYKQDLLTRKPNSKRSELVNQLEHEISKFNNDVSNNKAKEDDVFEVQHLSRPHK